MNEQTQAAVTFFTEDETGYGFASELLNSKLSNTEIEKEFKEYFLFNARFGTGTHIANKFFFHILSEALRQIDWEAVTATLVDF